MVDKSLASFTYDSSIPHDFASATYEIVHNIASANSWHVIEKYIIEGSPVFDWLRSIFGDNSVPSSIEEEIKWWKEQLAWVLDKKEGIMWNF